MLRAPKQTDFRAAAARCRILSHTGRLQIVDALAQGSLDARDMTTLTGMTSAAVKFHLSLLRAAGFITTTRNWRGVIYTLTDIGRSYWDAVEKTFF